MHLQRHPMATNLRNLFHAERWGISIAGGGARIGWLAGALAALLENRDVRSRMRVFYGSSAGALVGAIGAVAAVEDDDAPIRELMAELAALSPLRFMGVDPRSISSIYAAVGKLIEGENLPWGIDELVEQHMPTPRWQKLVRAGDRAKRPVELGICVTRQDTLEAETITTRGCRDSRILRRALVASASVPGLFAPVQIWKDQEVLYIDGCVVDLNPSAFLVQSDLAADLDAILVLGPTPVAGDATRRPVRQTPVRSVGERLGGIVTSSVGLAESPATSAVPVVRVGPVSPLPGGPLSFDPGLLKNLMGLGYTQLRAMLDNYPR